MKPLFGTVSSIREAFPDIDKIRLAGRQAGDVERESQREVNFDTLSIPKVIPCGNPLCQQGGFDIGAAVITLCHSRMASYTGSIPCPGHEGSPKGRIKGDPCMNQLEYTIETTFKPK